MCCFVFSVFAYNSVLCGLPSFFFAVAYLPVLCFLHVAYTTTYISFKNILQTWSRVGHLVVVSCTVAHSPRAGSIAYPPVLFFHSTWCCFVIISYPVSYLLVLCSAYFTFLFLYSFNSHITTRSDVVWCWVGTYTVLPTFRHVLWCLPSCISFNHLAVVSWFVHYMCSVDYHIVLLSSSQVAVGFMICVFHMCSIAYHLHLAVAVVDDSFLVFLVLWRGVQILAYANKS